VNTNKFKYVINCVDYVVTFTHLGRGEARLLVASTPVLLIAQMLLLTIYLEVFLGNTIEGLIRLGPFFHAFIWLIVVPLCFAALFQWWGSRFCHLEAPAGRAIAFSAGTRNSLVVLPLTFAIPGAVPILPAIIVAQTLIELIMMLIYVRFIPKLGATR
jgi:ACR3 family arsenite transporter